MTNLEPHPDLAVLESGQPCVDVDVLEPRLVPLGGPRAMTVYRTLPQRTRPLIGAWCFLDHYGPDDVSETGGMRVPRHPHTGLATVSWLFTGRVNHLDSNGVRATVEPGELNLMIAGRGITHQEISDVSTTVLHGVQFWYAMPAATRFSGHRFAHYVPDPIQAEGVTARVFIGELLGSRSPVDTGTTALLGAELLLDPGATVHLDVCRDFEYALLAESADVRVNGSLVPHRSLGYVPTGSDRVTVSVGDAGGRIIMLGGLPFDESIVMWWNFIGRSHEEIVEFRRRYQAELGFEPWQEEDLGKPELFGPYPAGEPTPLPAPTMPSSRLRPRSR